MKLFSWFGRASMPTVCFISHAYADQDIVQELVKRLPKRVSPFIFPPITVSPDERVSDDLVGAILNCGGLIYVNAPHSSRSVWVSFERDYALRAGKPVFSYAAGEGDFKRDRSQPLELPVFPSYSARDRARVVEVTSFMKDQRHFDLWTAEKDLKPESNWRRDHESALESRLSRGGYVVAFISRNSVASEFVGRELAAAAERWSEQILPVLLEPVSSLPLAFLQQAVVLHRGEHEKQSLDWNRVDDLIVRIYDLVYRNSYRKGGEPPTVAVDRARLRAE
jgi:hypothetical protein